MDEKAGAFERCLMPLHGKWLVYFFMGVLLALQAFAIFYVFSWPPSWEPLLHTVR